MLRRNKRKYHKGRNKWSCKKEKCAPLSPDILAASCALVLDEKRRQKELCLRSYFLSCLLFTTFSVNPFPGGRFLLFKNAQLVPKGDVLGEMFVCGCLQLSVKEKREKKDIDGNRGEVGLDGV